MTQDRNRHAPNPEPTTTLAADSPACLREPRPTRVDTILDLIDRTLADCEPTLVELRAAARAA